MGDHRAVGHRPLREQHLAAVQRLKAENADLRRQLEAAQAENADLKRRLDAFFQLGLDSVGEVLDQAEGALLADSKKE